MKLLHFGFKVHDIDRTVEAYRDLFGIDWDPVCEYTLPDAASPTGQSRSKVTHGHTSDGVEIEMVQKVEGVAVDDYVMGEREGISHIAFEVDDLGAERAKALSRGLKVVNEGSAPRASWFFILDDRLGGALVQLVQLNAEPTP